VMGLRGMRWIALLAVWAVAAAEEPKASVVLSKLQAEKIGSVALQRVGARQVVELVHERLVTHATREGYRLVWEVADPLPERPRVSFGVENGSLALLLEAAAGFADLAVTDNDEELVVRSRSIAGDSYETRRFPVHGEFWRSIRPRNPEEFFRQLGIAFPEGTTARRSRDRKHLVVTHNSGTSFLVDEILRATFAYPYSWRLNLAIVNAAGREMPSAEPLILSPRSKCSIRHSLGLEGSYVEVSAKEEHSYLRDNAVRFVLGIRAVRDGKTTFRQDTTLVLGHRVDVELRLAGSELLRVMAEKHCPARSSLPAHSRDFPGQWPWLDSVEADRSLDLVISKVEIDEEALLPSLRKLVATFREADPESVGLGVAYVVPLGPARRRTARAATMASGISVELASISAANVLDYVALGTGLSTRKSANGVVLHDPGIMMAPMQRMVYGPAALDRDFIKSIEPEPRTQARRDDRLTDLELVFGQLGIPLPAGARIRHTVYQDGWVAVAVNTPDGIRQMNKLMLVLDGGLSFSKLWHTEVRLVRLPVDAPNGDRIRELVASAGWGDRSKAGRMLASLTEHVLFSIWTSGFDDRLCVGEFPGILRGGGDVRLAVRATDRYGYNDAEISVDLSGAEGRRSWRSTMNGWRDDWPTRREWTALRVDSLGLGATSGGPTYLLVNHAAQLVLWGAEASRACQLTVKDEDQAVAVQDDTAEKPSGKRSADWDLLFLAGLVEAGGHTDWVSPGLIARHVSRQGNLLVDGCPHELLTVCARRLDRQGRLILQRSGKVTECLNTFGEEGSIPVPGGGGKPFRFTVVERILGEELGLRWRVGLGWPKTRRMAIGDVVRLGKGLHVRVEVVDASGMARAKPAFAEAVRAAKAARKMRIGWHRAVLDPMGGMPFGDFRLRAAPLPLALARIARRCSDRLLTGPKRWRLVQPVVFGPLPEGAEVVSSTGRQREGGMGGMGGRDEVAAGPDVFRVSYGDDDDDRDEDEDGAPCAGRERWFCGAQGTGMGMWMGDEDGLAEQAKDAQQNVPDQGGGIADSGLPDWRPEGRSCCSVLDLDVALCEKHRRHAIERHDEDEEEEACPTAVAYRLPVPRRRATVDLRNVTLAELLAELEKAYGVPLYLREKDGEVLVRAARLAHVARFGVPKKMVKGKTQAEFRVWLVKRGVVFQGDDRAVYFRALDMVVARGREDFVRQVGKALGKGREGNANVEHRTLKGEGEGKRGRDWRGREGGDRFGRVA
jgi:hypothetical protein